MKNHATLQPDVGNQDGSRLDKMFPDHRLSDVYRDFTHDCWGIGEEHISWLRRFSRENGRSPRILHIGNIANNAFKNAHILRKFGIECDVLCYNYFHVMACPEWEHADFDTTNFNFDAPDWSKVDLGDYERPKWFAQGRFATCVDYLIALCEGSPAAEDLWHILAQERDSGGEEFPNSSQWTPHEPEFVRAESERLAALYRIMFPERFNGPSAQDIANYYGAYLNERRRLAKLFSHYDLVIGYAADGLFPLIARKMPYVCFEHGTIRTFPFEDTLFGQLCALSYACASDVLISNCDNIIAARRLKLKSFRFLPHAMLEDFRKDASVLAMREELLARHDADFIVFHPSRQHWSDAKDPNWEKGNDRLIRAFGRFVANERPRAVLIMVAWGQTIDASRQLIEKLGISERVVWLDPKPMPVVGQYVAAADVLADQFIIGAWGAIMPHGMMLGTPTLLYLNDAVHDWCFPEMPPVLSARDDDEIHAALVQATGSSYRNRIKADGVAWHDGYHSENVVACRLIESLAVSLAPASDKEILRELRETHVALSGEHRSASAGLALSLRSLEASFIETQNQVEVLKAHIVGSKFTDRARNAVIVFKERRPVLGAILYHVLYWPMRGARAIKRGVSRILFG